MDTPLRVLLVEDSEDDALLIVRELQRSGYDLTFKQVQTAATMQAALAEQSWDAIIADYSMPHFSGMAALELLHQAGLDLPFIIVSGTIGEDSAVAAMKAGAHDYVLKDNLMRLGPAVRRELQEAQVRQARRQAEESLQESEARFRRMADSIQDGLTIVERGKVVYANDRACEIVGYPRQEYLTMAFPDFAVPEEKERLQQIFAGIGLEDSVPGELEFWIERKDGTRRYVQTRYSVSREGDEIVGHYVVTTDITERKLAEREVEERRKYLERMLAAAPDAIVTLEPQGRVVEWNPGAENLFGYSREEAIGQDIDRLIAGPETIDEALHFTAQVTGGQDVLPVEVIRRRKDKSPVDVIVAGSPILVEGKLMGSVAIYTDITERKQAELALRENEEKYSNLFHHSNDGIFLHDLEGTILDANQRAVDQLGYTRSELLSLTIPDLYPPEALEDSKKAFEAVARDGYVNFEIEFLKKNGQVFPADVSSSLFELGSTRVVQGVVRDITERKRAERLLQALNEAALAVEQALTPSEIFATVGDEFKKLGLACAIFLLDESKTRLFPRYYSYDSRGVKAAEKLLGVEAKSFSIPLETVGVFRETVREGKSVLVANNEGLRQVLPKAMRRFVSQVVKLLKVPKSVLAPLVVEDETIGLLSVQSDDLTPEDIPAITAFAHQMSAAWRKANLMQDLETSLKELKRTQAQFLQAQKMEAIGRLAGGVAHDFNNTLTIIHLSTQLLKRQLRPEDPLWEYVHQIEDAGKRAANLTKQLLSFSRREPIEPRVVNISQVVGDLSRMLQRIIGEDIELIADLADDLWPVYLDPTQLDQAIINLVVNARDAMPKGGKLTIKTANVLLDQARADRHIELRPGEYVLLAVNDTGIGMDQEVKDRIFEPFFTTKERERGTGLGLSTVFGIVRRHSGHILVESEVGQGTTFEIYLPRTRQTKSRTSAPSPPSTTLRGTETILVVEDDATVRGLAVQILASHGYQVLTASNGDEALAIGREHAGPIHLLLTDMVMPRMHGRDLADALKAQRPQTRVLFMSGYSDNMIPDQGIPREGIAFLPKPFTVETLTQKVRSVLDAPLEVEEVE